MAGASVESRAEELIGAAMEAGEVEDAALAASLEQRNAFWRIRESIPDAQRGEGVSIKHDISVPVASVPRFLEEADAAVAKLIPGVRALGFGHVGDGNVHYNVFQPPGSDGAALSGALARDRRAWSMKWSPAWAARSRPSMASAK